MQQRHLSRNFSAQCTNMAPLTNKGKILTKNSPDLNPVDYSACMVVATDGVLSQNFRQ